TGGDVDRHVHRARMQLAEARRFGASLREHPFAKADDEAGLLGEWDELTRGKLAGGGMLPADEGLVGHDLAAAEVDDGLVVEPELAPDDAFAQLADPLRPVEGRAVELRIEERIAEIGMSLRAVHRDVGFLEQRLVVIAEGDSDARARVERSRPTVHRTGDLLE